MGDFFITTSLMHNHLDNILFITNTAQKGRYGKPAAFCACWRLLQRRRQTTLVALVAGA